MSARPAAARRLAARRDGGGRAAPALLEVSGLDAELGDLRVLEDVGLLVEPGEIVAVIGPNGSGKTTLLRHAAGLLRARGGAVLLEGVPIASLPPRARALRVAYLPQIHELPAGFRAAELVGMGRHPHEGEGEPARLAAVARALEAVGGAALARRLLETLSGGELQKVFLASVVAQDAPLLVLDEPTVFLDPGRSLEIQAALLRLAALGRGLLVSTHDLDFVARSAHRVLALRAGRTVLEGAPVEVLTAAALEELFDAPVPAPTTAVGSPVSPVRSSLPAAELPRDSAARARPAGQAPSRVRVPAGLLGLACAAILLGAPLLGPGGVAAPALPGSGQDAEAFILWQLRVPRVLLAGAAGAALALAGAAFQALFRNALATPYTLGVASGAALGAVAVLLAGVGATFAGATATSLGALGGALGVTAAVYGVGRRREGLPTSTLLLAGVTLGFFVSALILLLQYFADFTQAFRILRWLMGEVRIVGYAPFAAFGPLLAAGALTVLSLAPELNLLLTGEELAAARGVPVESAKRRLLLGSSVLVAAVVALCGPIGFVGLVVPHAVRSLLGPDHRRLLPACVPAGAAFLVACDTAARLALAPAELPVGVVTALVGGPVFLAILLRRGPRRGGW